MRRLLKVFLIVTSLVVVVVVGFGAFLAWSYVTAEVDTVGEVDFDRPLAIPPLAESQVDDQGRRVFDLDPATGRAPTSAGTTRPDLGLQRRLPRADSAGRRAARRCWSTSATSWTRRPPLHWHGMHLPAAMDGGPHQPIAPGATWSPTWRIDQPAATLWYHPHPHGETAEHVYRGLAGMFILDDPDERGPGRCRGVRRRRHPGDRAGQGVRRQRARHQRRGCSRASASSATRSWSTAPPGPTST